MVAHSAIDHTGITGVGSGAVGAYDIERRTAGDLSVTSTSAGTAIPTLGTLSVTAAAGDLLLVGLDCTIGADADGIRLDVGTIVSAAVVNYLSSLSGTPASIGIPGWGGQASASVEFRIGHVIPYVVVGGDISGGTVTLGLRSWLAAGTTRTVNASSTAPLVFWCKNLLQ